MGKINFTAVGKRILIRTGGGLTGGAVGYGVDKLLSNVGPWGRIGIKASIGAVVASISEKNDFLSTAGAALVGCATQDMAHHTIGADSTSGVGNTGDEKEYVVDVDVDEDINGPQDSALGDPEDSSESAMGEVEEEEEDYGA